MRLFRIFFTLIVFFFALLFLMQNYEALKKTIDLSFEIYYTPLKWSSAVVDGQGGVPYYFIVVGAFAAGGLFTCCFWLLDRFKMMKKHIRATSSLKKSIRSLTSENKELKKQVDMLNAAAEKAAIPALEGTGEEK